MPIRPNAYAQVTWLTTAGASKTVAGDDDFMAKTEDGYMLRVEQMERNSWWWQVYGPDGEALVEESHFMFKKRDAFAAAEIVYMVHRQARMVKA